MIDNGVERRIAEWAATEVDAAVVDRRSWMVAYENPDGSGEILFYVCAADDEFRQRVSEAI